MITELTIKNFRGFDTLELKGLQRVNLIVGENNTGKTSLLEALSLVADPGSYENLPGKFRDHEGDSEKRFFRWLAKDGEDHARLRATEAHGQIMWTHFGASDPEGYFPHGRDETRAQLGRYELCHGGNRREVRAVSVNSRSASALAKAFSSAKSGKHHKKLVAIVQKIDPRIVDVDLFHDDDGPLIKADIGLRDYVPLAQLGQGVVRLLGLFSDIYSSGAELCLADEIENGIHHTVHRQVWQGIAEIAAALDIQVFATTHSAECLEAAHQVFVTDDPEQKRRFAVIRLMRVRDKVIGRVLDEDRVSGALESNIELR